MIAALITGNVFAQAPETMSYQAVIRNSSNVLVTNTQVSIRISILQGTANGNIVYSETQRATSNQNGLITLQIGTGITTDKFSAINWATGTYFIRTETDPTGGENYSLISGISQLMSVPYALFAKTAGAFVPSPVTGGIVLLDNRAPTYIDFAGAASFGLFTSAGAIANTGTTSIKGNIGSGAGAISGFGVPSLVVGEIHIADSLTARASRGLQSASTQLHNRVATVLTHPATFGSVTGETLYPGVYNITAAVTVNGKLILDGKNLPDAQFIIRTAGAFAMAAGSSIALVNGATSDNVFWVLDGAASIGANAIMSGVVVGNAAISVGAGTSLDGRIYSTAGAIAISGTNAIGLAYIIPLRIMPNADIVIKRNVSIGADLNVDSSAYLNKVGGSTTNYGAFTVERNSSTLLTGRLTVNGTTHLGNTLLTDGATTLGSTLNVAGVTTSTNSTQSTGLSNGALVVAGGAAIGGNLNVGGTVSFGGPSTFGGQLHITDQTQSSTTLAGAVIVDGGVGISKNVNVGGKSKFNDSVSVIGNLSSKSLNISDDVPDFIATFENKNVGAGDGIKIKLGRAKSLYTFNETTYTPAELTSMQDFKDLLRCDFPGGTVGKTNKLADIALAATIEDLKSMAGIAVSAGNMIIDFINTNLNLPLKIGPYTTPPFHISDPFDITGPINRKLNLPIVLPALSIPAVKFPALSTPTIVIHTPDPLPNIDLPGFEITSGFQISPSIPLIGVTTVMPVLPALSIPALDIPSLNVLPQLTVMPKLPTISIPGITPVNIFDMSFWSIPEICLTDAAGSSPLNNDNVFVRFEDKNGQKVGSIRGVSVNNWAVNFLNPAFLFKLRGALLSSKIDKFHAQYHFKTLIGEALSSYSKIGVEYTSGNGDYAEWLERSDKSEVINAGDIVAVKGGKITKDLALAEQVMVVSSNPIMLGNMPAEGNLYDGNNIAFIGQIPVKIMGPVATGDYIIGQSSTPGYGIAKHSNAMSIEDFRTAVGRSWVNDLSEGPKMVNTVVGVHNNNFLNIIKEIKEKEATNDFRLKAIEIKLNMRATTKTKSAIRSLPKPSIKSVIHD